MSQIKKNFLYNASYQIFAIIIPIILAPFLSRRLGTEGTGIYSYTYSIAYYFMLFVLLGINNYGSRCIAQIKDNKGKMSKAFLEIYLIQIILGITMLIMYLLYVKITNYKYSYISFIQTLFVLSAVIDINWFFYGLEEFKITVVRSFLLKILNFILIIVFVKTTDDVWKYALIMSATALANQLILWPFVKGRIIISKIYFKNIFKHLKPIVVLFIPVIAVSLYKMMDKIMLGVLANMSEVGLYEYAEKINSIPLTIISALGTVMLPKISNLAKTNENQKVIEYLYKALHFVLFISIPIFFIFLISMPKIIPLYLGWEFKETIRLVILLSITLPFVSFANVIRTQYLIPKERDKTYVKSVIVGAILNLALNIILIPHLKSSGACIGTIVAEISVMIYQTVAIRKEISFNKCITYWIDFTLKAIGAFVLVYLMKYITMNEILRISMQSIVLLCIYLILNKKYIKDNTNFAKI